MLKYLLNNIYLFLGILIGLYISSLLSDSLQPLCLPKTNFTSISKPETLKKIIPKMNPPKKPNTPMEKTKLIRPRYYSTELGIREKLFVGIFSSEEKINTQAVHLNKTIGHLVDQIKFFITAQYKLKSRFNVSGLVGFTDTRPKYRPFQVLKYISDNFIQDYDYFVLANDYTFINVKKLKDIVQGISVSMDVYLGKRVTDASFCNLDAGIILSNSVVKAMREHLDWCVMNAISDDNSENIGRCVHHSIGLNCQHSLQGYSLTSFKVKHFNLREHLLELSKKDDFNTAVTIHPILESDYFYLLNAYFLKRRLIEIKTKIDNLSEDLTEVWPPGQRPGAKPATRFDVPKQFYFNMTHMFFPDDFTNVKVHSRADLEDIKYIIDEVKLRESPKYQFVRLINGYRSFDLSRGLDYILDLLFIDLSTNEEITKRYEVCKPLGKVEFVTVPYVTETSRVTIILPIEETDIEISLDFLQNYATSILDRKEKTLLMLVLLYQADSSNKNTSDVFYQIKNFAIKTSNKYKHEDMKIAWVSIRLPSWSKMVQISDFKALDFAIVDLALKKIGLDSLVLVLDSHTNITNEFLNRVRMNTIANFQIFNPIPYRLYNPKITKSNNLDINKNNGHFDREEYRYVSFYSKDYVNVRKKHQLELPIVRVDADIGAIITHYENYTSNIFEMFVKYGRDLHPMRATEMGLKVKYYEAPPTSKRCNLFIGSASQLGRLLVEIVH